MRPTDASVVLTGAAGGLGSAIARQLLNEGARVLLVGRTAEPLLALAHALATGSFDRWRVDALVVDIATDQGRAALIDAAAARQCNVLINNAAVAAFGRAQDLQASHARQVVETNILAPMLLIAGMLPQLLSRKQAQIVNIGSILGSLGVPGFSAYGASKAALRVYTESLRRELADTPVRVQYYAPRAIDTPFNSNEVRAFNRATGSRSDKPDTVARDLVRMLRDETPQRYVGMVEALAVRLNSLFPGWMDGAFAKHRRALKPSDPTPGASS
ncbi:SDR family oxidoreductase [Bordetella genomosp. 11]|uniref:Short chain dehydrogenase n=1 Tax=Bordetella genomosp. 11 TaxID=1416808 RepID=A0A261UFL9_9BORD|nr:SDR family oxidoreductase [Bordetella genomosp. 11]OZI60729.1 short chain dehydrogenase [Bordetella genomosp. 11]